MESDPPGRLPFDDNNLNFNLNHAPQTPSYQVLGATDSPFASQKRSRSPSPCPVRDASSAVEHEGTEMSGKSPGAKRRRLDKHANTLNNSSAAPPVTTTKSALEIVDSEDSYEDEGNVVSAKRIKTSIEADGELQELYCHPSESRESQPLKLRGSSSHNTSNASREIPKWSAAKRYHSSKNSLPDYGPLERSIEKSAKPQQDESMRGRPGRGSFRPHNSLSSQKAAPYPPYPKHSAARYSPPGPPDGDQYKRSRHNPHKKQKLETGWSNKSSNKDVSDDDSYTARDRGRPERGQGQQDYYHNARRDTSPRPRDRRNMLRDNISDGPRVNVYDNDGFVKPQGRYSKRPLRGDDPNDPITDTGPTTRGFSKTVPQVFIKGLKGSTYHSPPQSNRSHDVALHSPQSIDSEDSMDDLADGHYKKPSSTLSSKHKRSEPESTKPNKGHVEPQTIHDTSDEETSKLGNGDIKPTKFPPSKKALAKEKQPEDIVFQILQVFSPNHPWFLGDAHRQLFVYHNRINGFLTIVGKGVPHLSMAVNSISSVEYNEESAMIIIRKSRDNSFGGATIICLTLANADDGMNLAKLLALSSTIKGLPKSRDYLGKVFATTRNTAIAKSKKQPPAKEEPASVTHTAQNPRSRVSATESSTRSPRVIDLLSDRHYELSKVVSGSTKTSHDGIKSGYTPTYLDLTSDESHTEVPASKFDNRSQATRSSTRLTDEATPSQRALSTEFAWTEANPGWKDVWKSSILYPAKGKDKATINAEDIARLDEGNYLNDNLIEFYARWLQCHILVDKPEVAKRIYIMNTFFYESLTNKDGKKRFNYAAVERWTAKVDLLSYDYIVVPVNENTHWYLAIICNVPKFLGPDPEAQETPQSQEDGARKKDDAAVSASSEPVTAPAESSQAQPQPTTPTKKGKRKSHGPPPRKYKTDEPRIITLDSLGLKHSPTCTHLKEYLVAEIKSKRGIDIPSPGSIGMTATNIPQQDNFSDCGLFLLNYLEKFLEQPDEFVHGMMQNTDGLFQKWPNASKTRADIRNILFDLQSEQISKAKSPKKSTDGDTPTSEKSGPESPAPSESRSPDENTSISSTEQAANPPIREQSATTLSDSSSFGGFSRLGSVGAGEVDNAPPIHKPTRGRQPTPFPAGLDSGEDDNSNFSRSTVCHGTGLEDEDEDHYFPDPDNDYYNEGPIPQFDEDGREECEDEADEATDDTAQSESRNSKMEDDEMLLHSEDDGLTNKSAARSSSPRLLSDPSFISSSSSSSTTPEQQPSTILSSRSSADKSDSPGTAYADAADYAIVGNPKKNFSKY